MKLESIATIESSFRELRAFDLIVLASGYESRCCDLGLEAHKFGLIAGADVLVLAFFEHQDNPQRKINDAILGGLSSRTLVVPEKDGLSVESEVSNSIRKLLVSKTYLNILVDISSMSRPWYAGVVLALRAFQTESPAAIDVVFGYTAGRFDGLPSNYPPSEIVCPVQGFCAAETPDRPTALVLGLGFDPGRGLGLREYLDPELTLVVSNGNPGFPLYMDAVQSANSDLFEIIDSGEHFEYDITDPAGTFYNLMSLCSGLAIDWRVVLASVGPKLIGLIFFFLAVIDNRLSVWRVSGGAKIKPRDVIGDVQILMKTVWR